MARKNYTAEQIIVILRKIEILCNQGKSIAESVKAQGNYGKYVLPLA